MTNSAVTSQIQTITQEIDRLIAEMMALRQQVLSLEEPVAPPVDSIRKRSYFGIWAERDDFQNSTSREWLERQRNQQWRQP